jgi:hypothetical protein
VKTLLEEFRQSSGAATPATSSAKPWEVEWLELSLKVHYIESDNRAELPGISVTFGDKVFQSAAAKLPVLQRRIRALERQHAQGRPMPKVRGVLQPALVAMLMRQQLLMQLAHVDCTPPACCRLCCTLTTDPLLPLPPHAAPSAGGHAGL